MSHVLLLFDADERDFTNFEWHSSRSSSRTNLLRGERHPILIFLPRRNARGEATGNISLILSWLKRMRVERGYGYSRLGKSFPGF
jgi:hypothetical protein